MEMRKVELDIAAIIVWDQVGLLCLAAGIQLYATSRREDFDWPHEVCT